MKMIATSSLILLVCGLLHATSGEAGVTLGSDTQVQAVARTRILGGSNRIARYAEMASGFILNNSSAACTFDSAFPVYGGLDMNSGQLTLARNLMLEGGATVTSLGRINGNGYSFYLAESMSSLGAASDGTIIFDAINLVLRSDITLNASIKFTGNSSIVSRNHTLKLGTTGALIVGSGGNLSIVNTSLQGIGANNVRCENASSRLILDNVSWDQSQDFRFMVGGLVFKNWVQMTGLFNGVFAYQTDQVSTVTTNSQLIVSSGFTFSYDPIANSSPDLIHFIDETSQFILDDATLHATTTGMSLQKGKLIIEGNSVISSEIDLAPVGDGDFDLVVKSVSLGNDNASTDMICVLRPGAELVITSGALDYRNISASSLVMQSLLSTIRVFGDARLRLYQNMSLGVGQAIFEDNAILSRVIGKDITGPLVPRGQLLREFVA